MVHFRFIEVGKHREYIEQPLDHEIGEEYRTVCIASQERPDST
jgi:hypothetical protein